MESNTLAEAGPSQPIDRKERDGSPKRRRKTRACDRCHRGGVKCSAGPVEGICGPCNAFGSKCTFLRPVKRRGPAPRHVDGEVYTPPIPAPIAARPVDDWVYRGEVAPHSVIEALIRFYIAVIYPMQPYYHLPTLLRRLHEREYTRSRPFFVDLMALCAWTAARIRDGATSPSQPLTPEMTSVHSEVFNRAALDSFPSDLEAASDFEYKRAKSNMALLCIQYGDTLGLQRHFGDYCTLCAMDGFHLESRWPPRLNVIDLEERRRLFWATYQLDVYSACTWGATIRHRESETTVLYPAEIYSDNDILPTTLTLPQGTPGTPRAVSWITGWNFVSSLYRILEHAIERVRIRRNGSGGYSEDTVVGGAVLALFERGAASPAEILSSVGRMHNQLPEELRVAAPLGTDEDRNRLGFQAMNIIITLQTVKMVVAGASENTSSVAERCAIAGDLLDAISNVPTAYIRSATILHHLAGIGHLLIPHSQHAKSRSLSQWEYLQVRACILSMADMLSGLESVLSRTAGIADKLRAHIERWDAVMEEAAREREGRGVVHAPWRAGKGIERNQERGMGSEGNQHVAQNARLSRSEDRHGESSTRSLPIPLPPVQKMERYPTMPYPGSPFVHNNINSGVHHSHPHAEPTSVDASVLDPSLLSSLANSAIYYGNQSNSSTPNYMPSTLTNPAGPLEPLPGYTGDGFLASGENLFSDWPFMMGSAFEFLGSS